MRLAIFRLFLNTGTAMLVVYGMVEVGGFEKLRFRYMNSQYSMKINLLLYTKMLYSILN